ncbi:MAG: DUF6132 family protein [Bacteroidales bacterium]|nr:DUF6132 family protein [Bacteroidales bacterium]
MIFKGNLKTWKFWKPIIFASVGALLGYLYYFYIGCQSGTCPITSNPYGSIVFGGLMGFLIGK